MRMDCNSKPRSCMDRRRVSSSINGRVAGDSLARVRPGGVLLAASCSAHVSTEEFYGLVRQAVHASGRRAEEFATTGHAPDHPATFPEARYLKGIYFRLGG